MLQFSLEPAACRVVGLWFFLPGAVAAPFIFWQSFVWGAVFFISWCVFALWLVPLRAHSLKGSISLGEIRVSQGILFKTLRRLPTRNVTGIQRVGTPLLRWCSCSLVILYTSGMVLVLPGLSDENTDLLLKALEEARL